MTNNRGVTIGHLAFMLIHFGILGFLILFSYLTWNNFDIISQWSKIISNLAIVLYVIQLLSFKYKKYEYTDFRLWFITLNYLFMFGRIFLNGYGLDNNIFWNLMDRHSLVDLYHASAFTLCLIQSLFIGFVFKEDQKIIDGKPIIIFQETINYKMYLSGIFLLLCSIPFRLYMDISYVIQTQGSNGYSLIDSTGLADDIAFLTLPSLIYIITSGKFKRAHVRAIVITTITYFTFVMILTGDRRYPITAIIAICLCYLKLYNVKLKFSRMLFLGFTSYIMLNFLAVLREARHENLTSIGNFISIYGRDILFGESTLFETLSEFGISFFSVVHIFEYIPFYIPFQYGFSFLASIPSLLPIGWLFGDFFSKASISGVINPIAGAPVGGSIIGELYANFGWFSLVAGTILGILGNKIFEFKNKKKYRLNCAKYYSLFYILINLVRSSFFEIFRSAFMVYFIPLFIMWFIRDPKKRGNKKTIL